MSTSPAQRSPLPPMIDATNVDATVKVRCGVVGFQFPNRSPSEWDENWLNVRFTRLKAVALAAEALFQAFPDRRAAPR